MHELIKNHGDLPRVAKLYLASQFFQALYFAWPIWYGFASLALSPFQIGMYFSVFSIVKVVAEVPTGAFGDKYGRRLSALLGAAIVGVVPLIFYFGHTFWAYMVAAVLMAIGSAFISGSLDALVYDDAKVSKETYRRVAWLEITFFQVGLIASTALGGFMYQLNPALPFIAEALAALATFLAILSMSEPARSLAEPLVKQSYLRYFGTGLRQLIATKYLKVILVVGVSVAVLLTACIEFVNEASMISFGLDPSTRGLLIAAVKIIALLVVNLVLLKLLRTDRSRLLFVGVVGTAIFALLSVDVLGVFLAGFMIFNWLSATQFSFFKTIINDNLPSSHRATANSGFSAVTGFVAFGVYAIWGWIMQTTGTPHAVYIISALFFAVVILPCVLWLVRHLKSASDAEVSPIQ